jgi:hypothetical protein
MTLNENSETSKLFIFITCIDGQVKSTIDKIKKIGDVTQIQQTEGPYDIVVTLESNSNNDLKKTLMHKIRSIDTVAHTLTLRASPDEWVLG